MLTSNRVARTLLVSLALGLVSCAERSSGPSSDTSRATAAAAPGPGRSGLRRDELRRYDPTTVETVRGTIVRVDRIASREGRASDGVHLLLSTPDRGGIAVHLGPSWYLDQQGVPLAPGDAIEVTGSRVTVDGAPAILARSLAREGTTLVLRDEAGRPAWSGGRRARR